jgi:HEAT repeat protein
MLKTSTIIAIVIAATGFLYFAAFVDYGINFEDEGALVYQFTRVADGHVPYNDIHMGYTPAIFYTHAAAMRVFGYDVLPGRWLLVGVNTLSLFFITLLSLRIAPPRFAWLPAVFYMAWIPVNPGYFAAFNIPYPAWYNVLFFTAGALTALRFAESGRTGWMLAAGALAGVSFAFKPNVGLFQLAASAFALLSLTPIRSATNAKVETVAWWSLWTCTLAGTWAVFSGNLGLTEITTLLLPATAMALFCIPSASASTPSSNGARITATGPALVGAFALVNLPWLAIVHGQLGTAQTLAKVFFVGTGFENVFYLAYPDVGLAVAIGLVAAGLAAMLPRIAASTPFTPVRLAAIGLAGFAAAVISLARLALMPQGFAAAIVGEVELGAFALTLIVHWAALIALALRAKSEQARDKRDGVGLILLCFSVFMYLQIYPRTDFMHWITAAPLSLVVGIGLLSRIAERWSEGATRTGRAVVASAFLVPFVFVVLVRAAPRIAAVATDENGAIGRPPSVQLQSERARVWMNQGRAPRYADLDNVVAFLREHSEPDEEIFTFPVLELVSFLSGRHISTRRGYFFPRSPAHDEEAEAVASLIERKPRYAVVLNDHVPYFVHAHMYFYDIVDYLAEAYRPHARFGPYVVLRRRDADAESAVAVSVPRTSMTPPAWLEEGLASADAAVRLATLARADALMVERFQPDIVAALEDEDPAVRDRAVWTLQYSLDPDIGGALARAAAEGRLSPREQVLALRIADHHMNAEGVAHLLALARDAGGRVQQEAKRDFYSASVFERAAEYWQRDDDSPSPPRIDPLSPEAARTLRRWIEDPTQPADVRGAAIWAAAELPDEQVELALGRSRLLEPPATSSEDARSATEDVILRAVAAYESALRGTPAWSIPEALAVLRFEAGDLEYLIPRLVMRTYDGSADHDRQLAEALTTGDLRVRREAGWLAAVIGGPQTLDAAVSNLRDEDPKLRASAIWALHRRGETQYAEDIERLRDDPDSTVRQFAERAAKQFARVE